MKRRDFQWPADPISHVVIDKRALSAIKDIANKIWQTTRTPDANMIMFEALKQYMERKGAVANFTVPLEGISND